MIDTKELYKKMMDNRNKGETIRQLIDDIGISDKAFYKIQKGEQITERVLIKVADWMQEKPSNYII